ncbi:hypothetical protein EUTSA_v10006413mg, partial [Eutrema salsugineum]
DSDDETVDVNGFQILSSQLKKAYIDVLLDVIETLCRSPHELTSPLDNTIFDLEDVGFKLDWVKMKLWKVYVKKKQEQESSARIRELQEKFYFENELENEKNMSMTARAPLDFSV